MNKPPRLERLCHCHQYLHAKKKGEANATRKIVLEMHREGIDKQVIAKVSHLSFEEVKQMLSKEEA
jgi:hypothetical protein